jgi:hypothetical protein
MFVVLYFMAITLKVFKPWLLVLPSHGIINITYLSYQGIMNNKKGYEEKCIVRFIGVIAIIVSLSNVIRIGIKIYNENIIHSLEHL